MKNFKKYFYIISLFSLGAIAFLVFSSIYANNDNKRGLEVAFLDVGQGDSTYIECPNKTQILIDGGPDDKILESLGKVMPFGDKTIDIVIATHADFDHIGGLSYIFDNYDIKYFIQNDYEGETQIYKRLQDKIKSEDSQKIIIKNEKKIVLDEDENIYLDIISPRESVKEIDTNDGSIVARLVYGKSAFMLTGDATIWTENQIMQNKTKEEIQSNILKLGHHGAKTSSSYTWLSNVSPEIAVISAGKDNRYGHPSKETLEKLLKLGMSYMATYDIGNIIFYSDGITTRTK